MVAERIKLHVITLFVLCEQEFFFLKATFCRITLMNAAGHTIFRIYVLHQCVEICGFICSIRYMRT